MPRPSTSRLRLRTKSVGTKTNRSQAKYTSSSLRRSRRHDEDSPSSEERPLKRAGRSRNPGRDSSFDTPRTSARDASRGTSRDTRDRASRGETSGTRGGDRRGTARYARTNDGSEARYEKRRAAQSESRQETRYSNGTERRNDKRNDRRDDSRRLNEPRRTSVSNEQRAGDSPRVTRSRSSESRRMESRERSSSFAGSEARGLRSSGQRGMQGDANERGRDKQSVREERGRDTHTPNRKVTTAKPKAPRSERIEQSSELRLNKFLADAGIASRRTADELIDNGVVKVNGKVVREKGTRVHPSDLVTVNGEPVSYLKHLTYLVLNKPKDYITTTSDEKGRKTVMDLIPLTQRLYPVGRLDRNTTGTLIISNDGELATRLMHPKYEIEREYVVGLDKRLNAEHAKTIAQGVALEDGMTGPAELFINPDDRTEVRIVLREGRNREVRRLFEHFGYEVIRLHRARYATIMVTGLSRGEYRHLTRDEVRTLRRAVGLE